MFSASVIGRGSMSTCQSKQRRSSWMDDQPPLVAMVSKSLSRSNPPRKTPIPNVSTDVLHCITSDSFTSSSSFRCPNLTSFTIVLFFNASRIASISTETILSRSKILNSVIDGSFRRSLSTTHSLLLMVRRCDGGRGRLRWKRWRWAIKWKKCAHSMPIWTPITITIWHINSHMTARLMTFETYGYTRLSIASTCRPCCSTPIISMSAQMSNKSFYYGFSNAYLWAYVWFMSCEVFVGLFQKFESRPERCNARTVTSKTVS